MKQYAAVFIGRFKANSKEEAKEVGNYLANMARATNRSLIEDMCFVDVREDDDNSEE